ncbi:hypothetical protein MRB53_039499 [Persea americana]|nr:hypothetical protein MRB53_039499 [Persea americana]
MATQDGETDKQNSNYLDLETTHGPTQSSLPALNFHLYEHKTALVVYWTLMVFTSGIWPIMMYFALYYTHNSLTSNLSGIFGVALAIPGIESLYSGTLRTYRLYLKAPTYRPIGAKTRWEPDFFQLNFAVAGIVITILICIGSTINNYPACSLPIACLLLQLVIEILVAQIAVRLNLRTPISISSVRKGDKARPATYTMVEDVIAVDGGQGLAFRTAWDARYRASPQLRAFLNTMDVLWGGTAALVVIAIFAVVFGVSNPDVGYALGWALPWIWGGIMALITMVMTKRMLAAEKRAHSVVDLK